MGYLKPQPRGWLPWPQTPTRSLSLKSSHERMLSRGKPVFSGKGDSSMGSHGRRPQEAAGPAARRAPSPAPSARLPPGAAASGPLSSAGLPPPSRAAEGRGRGGGGRQLTHLKRRSRPCVWLANRVKTSMAPSPGPHVAPASSRAVECYPVPGGARASGRRRG